jgi:FkbM family methyltransferase
LNRRSKSSLPPLRFRNGFVWNHSAHDDPIEVFREIFVDHFYDPIPVPPAGATVLDLGANIGAVTMYLAAGRPDLTFHAYEPNPDAFGSLRRNLKDSGIERQVVSYPEAVGGTAGRIDLWVDVPTVLSTSFGNAPAKGARKISVPMITLDEAWERMDRRRIWLLKIDTEGAEGDILDNASASFLAAVQTACIEWHNNIVPGVFERCRKRLEAAGFTLQLRPHPWDEGIIYATVDVDAPVGLDVVLEERMEHDGGAPGILEPPDGVEMVAEAVKRRR